MSMAIGGARYLRPTGGAKPPQVRIKEKVEPSPALVHVQMLVVFSENVYHSFLLLDAYGLEITPTGIGQTCPLVWGSEL